jgi:L-serine kinase (ADP)
MSKKIDIISNSLIKPHETIRLHHAYKILDQIRQDGFVKQPLIVEKNTMILLDGHHRFYALKELGLSSSPVYLCRLQ